ncbi:hypothetical protein QCA50_020332 [Cerrena zonata]|uniref:Uncharacterized protein n=1 Tax=Cerrena zonata TaxID=2478898 RepID=A0AAW0FCT1_9APHY
MLPDELKTRMASCVCVSSKIRHLHRGRFTKHEFAFYPRYLQSFSSVSHGSLISDRNWKDAVLKTEELRKCRSESDYYLDLSTSNAFNCTLHVAVFESNSLTLSC